MIAGDQVQAHPLEPLTPRLLRRVNRLLPSAGITLFRLS
jgi:hypothetical protein